MWMTSFLVLLTNLCEDFVHKMQGEFEMSMIGELNYFVGFQVKKMDHGTFLRQTNCKKLLKKFEMDKSKDSATPMATNYYLSADEKGKTIDLSSLLYLLASRSDIMFSVYMYACYQSGPMESNIYVVKKDYEIPKRHFRCWPMVL